MTWGEAEKVVARVIRQHHQSISEGRVGLSLVRKITDALRQEDLLKEE